MIRSYRIADDTATPIFDFSGWILRGVGDNYGDEDLNYSPCVWALVAMWKWDVPLATVPKNNDFIKFDFLGLWIGKKLEVTGNEISVVDVQKQITPSLMTLFNRHSRGNITIYNIYDTDVVSLKEL